MNLTFRIQYRTVWGESLQVIFNENENQTCQLSTRNGIDWQGECTYTPKDQHMPICYRYGVFRDNICIRKELGAIPHLFYAGNAQQNHYIINDCWRDLPFDNYRYTSAFNIIHELTSPIQPADSAGCCITFRALCPGLKAQNQALGLIGSCNALGNWEYCRPLRMQEVIPNVWYLALDASKLQYPFEYKFVIINAQTGAVDEWENGNNHTFQNQSLQRGETFLSMEEEICFNRIPKRLAGSSIPVFSLRSEGSCGIGDFGDLRTYIQWALTTNQRIVQILPINDTTTTRSWKDSYPYSCISIYALHPIYIDLRQLPSLRDSSKASLYEKERIRLNNLQQVDYEEVIRLKEAYLHDIFLQEGDNIISSSEYQQFFNKNKEWLIPYAAFCYFRDYYHTADFTQWKKNHEYNAKHIQRLCNPTNKNYPELAFHFFVQYELHLQLLKASNYGKNNGIVLKGDIPIGISRHSVEAWMEPQYFNMNGQAGAPPDAFSAEGQNWGMPTYNWDIMAQDNYRWWRQRFQKMSEYFTAYRIDHILGFFRIWETPIEAIHGTLGQFVPSLPMSKEEIQSFGLKFQEERMTEPFIDNQLLTELFGEKRDEIIQIYLQLSEKDHYKLKPEFKTQRQIETYFADKKQKENYTIKEKLQRLIGNVLFLKDRKEKNKYHPRIDAQRTTIFKQLSWNEQEAFNRLYNHYYYQRHNEFWYREAIKKLPVLIQATPMLACGEDLGMVPACVPWLMKELQILSLEVQRMPKQLGMEFGETENYPFLSVCTIGTHDMSTLRGWWEENRDLTTRFYQKELGWQGEAPLHATGKICESIIQKHLQSPSLLCILTWQDWTSIDEKLRNPNIDCERINIPSNPHHYWHWRMHLSLENLMSQHEFNHKIAYLIKKNGRI